MQTARTLEFNILTKVGGEEQALQQIVAFHGTAAQSLDDLTGRWAKYAQSVGVSTTETARQLNDLSRAIKLSIETLETTPATKVRIDTGDMTLLTGELDKVDPRAKQFIDQIRNIEQTYAQATFPMSFKKEVATLGEVFQRRNPDLEKFNSTIQKYLSLLDTGVKSMTQARAVTANYANTLQEAAKIKRPTPVEYAFKIEPEIVTQLKEFTGGLATNLEAVSRVDDASTKLIDTTDTLKKAMQDASRLGLDPLADRFKEINIILEREIRLRTFADDVSAVTQAARASTTPFADLRQGIDRIANSSSLAGLEFQEMRTGLQSVFGEVQKREQLIDFANKLRALGEASNITDMKQMRVEMASLRTEAQKIGFDEVVKALDLMDQEMAKGGGFIKKFRSDLIKIADTTKEKTGVETIIVELEKFGKEAQSAGVDVDALIRDLRKFAIAPIAAKDSLDKTTKSLETLTQAAGVTARKSFVNLENNLKSTTQKMADTTTKSGGLAQSLSKLAFGVGGVGKLFGDMWVNMSKGLIAFGIFGVARNIIRDFTQVVSGAARAVYNLSYESAKLRDAEVAFRNIVGPARNAGEILSRVSVASAGAIERIELVGAATRAALAGLPVERFDELVTGARALAAATGRDASDALERLTNAIAKQERRLLDELGIIVRANEVYKEYANKIGVSATALTGAQRAAAFFETVVGKVNEKVMMLGGTVDSAQIPFMRFQASVRNLRESFGGLLDRTLGVSETLTGLSGLMDGLSASFSSTSEKSSRAMAALNSTEQAIRTLKKTVPDMIKEAEALNVVLNSTTASTNEKEEADKRLKEITQSLIGLFPNLATILKDDLTNGLKQASAAAKEHLKVQQALFSLQLSKTIDTNREAFKKAREELDEQKTAYDILESAIKRAINTGEKLVSFTATEAALVPKVVKLYENEGIVFGRIGASLEKVTQLQVQYRKTLIESQNTVAVLNHDVARLVKSMIDQGEAARSDIEAFAKMDEKATNYNDTLLILSGRLGIAKEDLDDARQSIYNLLFAIEDTSKKEVQDIETLQKNLSETRKKWDEFRNVIVDVDIDVDPIKRAESELESLKAERNDLVLTMIKGAGLEEAKDKEAIDKMMADYKDYMFLRKNLALTEDKDLQGLYQKWRNRLDQKRTNELEQLHLSEEIFDMVFAAEQKVYEKELALAKQRGQAVTDEAKRAIEVSNEKYETEMDIAKRTLQAWEDTRAKLIAKSLLFGASEKLVLNEIAQAHSRITKLERDEHEKVVKERIKSELEVYKVAVSTLSETQGLQGEAVAKYLDNLQTVTDKAPEQFKQTLQQMIDLLKKASVESGKIDKETIDKFGEITEEQLLQYKQNLQEQAKSDAHYAKYVSTIDDLRRENLLNNINRETISKIKQQKLYKDMQKEFYDITVATNEKQADEALAGIKRRISDDEAFIEDTNFLRTVDETAERLHQEKLSTLQRDYTETTLLKIKQAKDLDALEKIRLDIDAAEASAISVEQIWNALTKRQREILEERYKDIVDIIAKQNDIEKIAAIERVRSSARERDEELALLEKDLSAVTGNEEKIKKVKNLRTANAEFRDRKIEKIENDFARKNQLQMLKYEKGVTHDKEREAELRIQISTEELINSLENERQMWRQISILSDEGSKDQIEALFKIAEIDKQIAAIRVKSAEELANELTKIASDEVEEETRAIDKLANYVGASSKLVLKLRLDAAEAERNAMIEIAREYIEDEQELQEALVAIDKTYDDIRIKTEEEFYEEIAALATEKLRKSKAEFDEFLGAIADSFGENFDKISSILDGFVESYAKTLEALRTKQTAQIQAAALSWQALIFNIVFMLAQAHQEAKQKMKEEAKAAREEMKAVAQQVGDEIGEAITSGLEIDFDVLINQFVKANLAKNIADIFSEQFGQEFERLRLAIGGKPTEREIKLFSDEWFKIVQISGVPALTRYLKRLFPPEVSGPITAKLTEFAKDGLSIDELKSLAEEAIKLRMRLVDQKEIFADMGLKFNELKPTLTKMVDGAEQTFGSFSDEMSRLDEQIPTATFRAVTEPQANQMLVLMGRQTDYLAQIASNTARLNQLNVIPPGELPGGGQLWQQPAAAPALNGGQNININERLDITINGNRIAAAPSLESIDPLYLAGIIAERQQAMIDRRESALGRSKMRSNRTR